MSEQSKEPQASAALMADLEQTRSALSVANARAQAATQTVGEVMGGNIELKAGMSLLTSQVQQLNAGKAADNAKIEKLEGELKNLQPEATANQLIELNNEIARLIGENTKLTEENARLNRVVGALDAEVTKFHTINRDQGEPSSDAA